MKYLQKYSWVIFCLLQISFFKINAQEEETKNFKHSFTTFHLEARAGFEYLYEQTYDHPSNIFSRNNHYGFHGDYFNFLLGGDIGEHISYFIRQRIIPKPGYVSFFDNTDFLYLQYRFNKNWSIRIGKEALYVGGFEYDAPPIDVYFYTDYWGAFPCFHIGVSGAYTDNYGKNKIVLQVANSPYVQYTASDWKKGLLSYNIFWNGNFGPFSTLYSVNFMEYERGRFINYIALGNKLTFPKWEFYIDYINRAYNFNRFFYDFSVVSRLDWHVCKSVNLFAKGGFDRNLSELKIDAPIDMLMFPGYHYFYGLGLEFRPRKFRDLRIHAFFAHDKRGHLFLDTATDNYEQNLTWNWTANVGASWKIDFMKFLPEKLKK